MSRSAFEFVVPGMSDMEATRADHDPLVPYTADIWVRLSRLPRLLRVRDQHADDPTPEDEKR